AGRGDFSGAVDGHCAGFSRRDAGGPDRGGIGARIQMKWLLLLMVIGATTVGDVCRSLGMRQHGEIHDFRMVAIGKAFGMVARNVYVIISTLAMAVSFFSFMKLVSIAPMS